jgi:hypothetical protein
MYQLQRCSVHSQSIFDPSISFNEAETEIGTGETI